EEPGHLPGFGPVLAEIARETVARQTGCRWEYIVTDGGRPVATGTIRRRPTAAMRRRIRAQHPTCVWPGCRMPARQADIDHRRRWSEGGPTTLWNLAPLCEAHHTLLDKGWRYEPGPEGDFVFVSPLGNRYASSGRSPAAGAAPSRSVFLERDDRPPREAPGEHADERAGESSSGYRVGEIQAPQQPEDDGHDEEPERDPD